MRIDLICAGVCRDNGLPTQISGCGIIVRFVDDHDRVQTREFGWALGGSTARLADIMSARLALSSVLPQFRGNKTLLYTNSKYLFDLLNGTISPKKNIEAAEEVKRWYGYYKDIGIVVYKRQDADDSIARVQMLAEQALESQEHFDSGTVGLED